MRCDSSKNVSLGRQPANHSEWRGFQARQDVVWVARELVLVCCWETDPCRRMKMFDADADYSLLRLSKSMARRVSGPDSDWKVPFSYDMLHCRSQSNHRPDPATSTPDPHPQGAHPSRGSKNREEKKKRQVKRKVEEGGLTCAPPVAIVYERD